MNMLVFWLIAAGVFLVIEVVTAALCSIWFVLGALVSAVSTALGAPFWLQLVLFFVVSIAAIALIYPKTKHLISRNRQATNADMLIGKICVVTERIDNIAATGAVSVDGKTWTARTAGSEPVEAGAFVRAKAIQGVKLIVTPAEETAAV